ncbi:MAG: Rrf2 family transcriptional regulator [Candidatus Omnitrophota bacterium]
MKLITKNTDYALRALIFLGHNDGEFISSRLISEEEKIPLQFLRGILRKLINHGLVVAKEGVDGGVKLKSKLDTIYFSDVIRIFQGNIQLAECMFRKRICQKMAKCILRKRIRQIQDKLAHEFDNINLKSLLK